MTLTLARCIARVRRPTLLPVLDSVKRVHAAQGEALASRSGTAGREGRRRTALDPIDKGCPQHPLTEGIEPDALQSQSL